MLESTFLAGKVRTWSLPIIEGRPAPDAPRLKRLRLPQGELAQIYDGLPGIQYLALIELLTNTVRGNHFHDTKREFIYMISGEILLIVEDVDTKSRASFQLKPGDQAMISTRVAHTLQVLKPGYGIEFSPLAFDPGDVQPYALV